MFCRLGHVSRAAFVTGTLSVWLLILSPDHPAFSQQAIPPIATTPFIATQWTTTTASNPDGSTTISTKRLVIERSSSGAIRKEAYEASTGKEHRLNTRLLFVAIQDEPQHRLVVLNPASHSAQVSALEPRIHAPWTPSDLHGAKPAAVDASPSASNLGHATLAGLDAVGRHRSYVAQIKEGSQVSPVQVTEEAWFSPAVRSVVKSESHDEKGHSTVVTLEDIKFLEPDASLFAIPANYSVVRK